MQKIAGKIGHSPHTAKSSEKIVLFLHKNRIFLCKALPYSPHRRRLDVGSRMLSRDRDFCQARTMTPLPRQYRCAAEVAKDLLPGMRLSGSEVRSRQEDHSLPQRKEAMSKSNLQNTPPQARSELSGGPSRVGLAILVLANLFIFAGFIYSIALGLVT